MDTTSSVGGRRTYEADDQRKYKESELQEHDRYKEGQPHSHRALDSKDERSIANKLAREEKRENEPEAGKGFEAEQSKKDSTLPALQKGNEPSKGAKVDQQLKDEENEELRKKGKFGPNVD